MNVNVLRRNGSSELMVGEELILIIHICMHRKVATVVHTYILQSLNDGEYDFGRKFLVIGIGIKVN